MGVQLFVYLVVVILNLALKGLVAAKTEAAGEECRITRCSHHGPEIRFPFWVKDQQPEHCGHPAFRVSCHWKEPFVEFQYLENTSLQGIQLLFSVEQRVGYINYTSQEIELLGTYKTKNLTLVSTSMLSPYATVALIFHERSLYESINTSFLSCPSSVVGKSIFVTSLDGENFPVYYFQDFTSTSEPSIASCTKVFSSSLPNYLIVKYLSSIRSWSTPNCRKCEAKGEYCKLMNNETSSNVKTADHSTICFPRGRHQSSIKPIAGIIPGTALFVLVLVVLLKVISESE
ncbi:hypothetical protein POM88_053675 [Heracleum sosnowskyi]|uniref:RING-type E3 ubiquitin transferase n=1 Tax=Heracleum sosnowskyi TaxID=360622 RepID=A0AAD8LWY7_9APIA|nr:hypothetical protein POM88_053675 [Heracleum sosnowskyi]